MYVCLLLVRCNVCTALQFHICVHMYLYMCASIEFLTIQFHMPDEREPSSISLWELLLSVDACKRSVVAVALNLVSSHHYVMCEIIWYMLLAETKPPTCCHTQRCWWQCGPSAPVHQENTSVQSKGGPCQSTLHLWLAVVGLHCTRTCTCTVPVWCCALFQFMNSVYMYCTCVLLVLKSLISNPKKVFM